MVLNTETIDEFPYIEDVLNINIYKFITLVANNYKYTGTTHYLMVNLLDPMFLKEKTA